MELKALVNFSYQNRSFKSGQEFTIDDPKMADTLLKSGHAVQSAEVKQESKRGSK